MALRPADLGQRVVDALSASGVAVNVETPLQKRPLLLASQLDTQPRLLRVFVWRITHGGASRSAGEYRVQATRPGDQSLLLDTELRPLSIEQELEAGRVRRTLLLGYHEELDVFAAWDARVHPNPTKSASLQVSLDLLHEAQQTGFASRVRQIESGRELVIAFDPPSVVAYLEVFFCMHAADLEPASPEVEAATHGAPASHFAMLASSQKRYTLRTISTVVRDQRFRVAVLRAYRERCAFCGMGLGITEAAHIWAAARGGPDVLVNGIAACPSHHKAFDRGLLLVDDDGRVRVNEKLAAANGISRADCRRLRGEVGERLWRPRDRGLRPDPSYLARHREQWEAGLADAGLPTGR